MASIKNQSILIPKRVCEKHPSNEGTMYCDQCEEVMCRDCAHTRHAGHKTKSLDIKAAEIIEKYSSSSHRSEIEKLEDYLRETQKVKVHNDRQQANTLSELENRKQILLKWVNEVYQEQKKRCQKQFGEVAKKLSKTEEIVQAKLKFAEFLDKAKTLSSSAYEIVQTTKSFKSKLRDFDQMPLELTLITAEFKELKTKFKDVQRHFEVDLKSQGSSSPKRNPFIYKIQSNDIISSFGFPGKDIKIVDIIPITEQTAWIHRMDSRKLVSMTDKGKKDQEVKLAASNIDGLIFNDDSAVYTDFDKKCIWKTSVQGETRELCSTKPLHPYGLCRMQEGGYLVCLNERDPSEDVSKHTMKSKRGISKVSENGKLTEMTFYHQKTAQNYEMKFPIRVIQSSQGRHIGYVDRHYEDDTGVVVLADNNGNIIRIYEGSPDEQFDPMCLCFDEQSMLLISDFENSKIHSLNTVGTLIQLVLLGRMDPICIAVCNDRLWIGDDKGRVYICWYKK